MRIRIHVALLTTLALFAASANTQSLTGTIRIVVREAGSQRPIQGVEIRLTSPPECFDRNERVDRDCMNDLVDDLPDNEAELLAYLTQLAQRRQTRNLQSLRGTPNAVTDAAGNAIFENVDLGQYGIEARLNGYVALSPRSSESSINPLMPEAPSPMVTLHQKKLIVDISLSTTPSVSLRGRVLDANRRPIAGARLVVGTTQSETEPRTFLALTSVTTNEAGEYAFVLAPGNYVLRLHALSDPSSPTYFPGVADLGDAAVLHLEERKDASNIDFNLQ